VISKTDKYVFILCWCFSENKNVDESETQSQNVMTKRKQTGNIDADSAYSEIMDNNILDEVDVSKYLVRKKEVC